MPDSPANQPKRERDAWSRLLALAATLRGPEGCPWDREQTAGQLAGHLVEEAFETLDATLKGPAAALGDELGDTCFLIALLASALEDAGGDPLDAILGRTIDKVVRRHPHVFGREKRLDRARASGRWEEIKREERLERRKEQLEVKVKAEDVLGSGAEAEKAKRAGGGVERATGQRAGVNPSADEWLDPPPPALPALLAAARLQSRAAAVGFDWPEAGPILEKIREEIQELQEAMERPGGNLAEVKEELGDLLFSVVNLSRRLDQNPEQALRAANRKFRVRFNQMASEANDDGHRLEELSLEEMDRYWEAAKRRSRDPMDA